MTTLIITFKCPNDDTEIEVRLPVVGKKMSLDKLDAIPFLFIARSVSGKDRYKGVVDLEFDAVRVPRKGEHDRTAARGKAHRVLQDVLKRNLQHADAGAHHDGIVEAADEADVAACHDLAKIERRLAHDLDIRLSPHREVLPQRVPAAEELSDESLIHYGDETRSSHAFPTL